MAKEPRLAIESIAGQRPYQEDSVIAQSLSDGRVLVAVADGMGGHAAGEVASALALETLVNALEDGVDLDKAFVLANTEVFEMAKEPGKQGMGTTLVAALIEAGEFLVANVGDSRGYLVSGDGIRQLTEDHSFVAEAMKRGQTKEEAEATPWRDALTRSIGTEEHVDVDVFGPFPVKQDTALIICSDGLYKTLSDDELRRIFALSGSPRGAAQSLVTEAFEQGSDDNISVAIAEHGEVPRVAVQGTMPISFKVPAPEEAADEAAGGTPAAQPISTGSADPDAGEMQYRGDETLVDTVPSIPPISAPPKPAPAESESPATEAADDDVIVPAHGGSGPPVMAIVVTLVVVAAVVAALLLF